MPMLNNGYVLTTMISRAMLLSNKKPCFQQESEKAYLTCVDDE